MEILARTILFITATTVYHPPPDLVGLEFTLVWPGQNGASCVANTVSGGGGGGSFLNGTFSLPFPQSISVLVDSKHVRFVDVSPDAYITTASRGGRGGGGARGAIPGKGGDSALGTGGLGGVHSNGQDAIGYGAGGGGCSAGPGEGFYGGKGGPGAVRFVEVRLAPKDGL